MAAQQHPWVNIDGNIENYIEQYFHLGYKYNTILSFLETYHGVQLTLRQLKYVINIKLQLRRVGNSTSTTSVNDVYHAISMEIVGPSSLIGYRAMTDILKKKYGFVVSRNLVMKMMRFIDPAGCLARRKRRLKRRRYFTNGPNRAWHIDGYDKLSRFGFCISGAIDGFSRKIIFLNVGPTNHDPRVISHYYLDAVKLIGGYPQVVQTDCGTENGIVATLQTVFCIASGTSCDLSRCHRYSSSPSNQRIECWWSQFRKSRSEWWINKFGELTESGLFDIGNVMHKHCLQYSFMELLQDDLDFSVSLWNTHRIRPSRMTASLPGVPNELFYLPHTFGKC